MTEFCEYKIIKASRSYLDKIVDLAHTYTLYDSDKNSLKDRGFLVSGFTLSDYEEYLNLSDHFYVLLKDNELIGFLMAYSSDKITADEVLNSYIIKKNPYPFILIKQICIHKNHKGKGYAKLMYEHLFSLTGNSDYFAAIVLKPINEVSIRFHESVGFIKQFEYKPSDGMLRGVWKRN